jgi:hypothetical protein
MPNCFSLTRKTDKEAGPVALQQIDNELCEHFNVGPDPEMYCHQWVDTIGFALATGQTFTAIIRECHANVAEYPDDNEYYRRKLAVAEYLNEHFVSLAWAEMGGR